LKKNLYYKVIPPLAPNDNCDYDDNYNNYYNYENKNANKAEHTKNNISLFSTRLLPPFLQVFIQI